MNKIEQYIRPGAIVPVNMETTRLLVDALREALAQPEHSATHGEPVGVVDSTISGHIDWLCTFFPKQGTKLYTTPPQRKPLTDEQMTNIITTMCNTDDGTCDTRAMCRAIEAAHGIKDEA